MNARSATVVARFDMGGVPVHTTLVLNASFEPLAVVPLRRAILLVLSEKAVVLDAGADAVRSERMTMAAPRVIKLVRYIKVPFDRQAALTRTNLSSRDHGRCAYCGGKGTTIDHVVPRSAGGRHEWRNVVLACGPCNNTKASRTLADLGWALSVKPAVPRMTGWIIVGLAARDRSWEPYLVPVSTRRSGPVTV
jgi:5-methylcytosine-specific restriction endonuclease McrA